MVKSSKRDGYGVHTAPRECLGAHSQRITKRTQLPKKPACLLDKARSQPRRPASAVRRRSRWGGAGRPFPQLTLHRETGLRWVLVQFGRFIMAIATAMSPTAATKTTIDGVRSPGALFSTICTICTVAKTQVTRPTTTAAVPRTTTFARKYGPFPSPPILDR